MLKNYQVIGQSPSDEENLAVLGIAGMRSGGLGLVIQNDTRDSDNRPTLGWVANLDNIAFREALGGDDDYDLYRFDLRCFWGQRSGYVLAVRQSNQWTFDAPLEAEPSIALRGYKTGSISASTSPPSRWRSGFVSRNAGEPPSFSGWVASTEAARSARTATTSIPPTAGGSSSSSSRREASWATWNTIAARGTTPGST